MKRVLKLALAAALALISTMVGGTIVMQMWPSTQFEINGGALMRRFFGYGSLREKTNTSTTATPDVNGGAFRISCRTSHMGFFDPILYPGINNISHLHTFNGNSDLDFDTDFSVGLSTIGRSSCIGGIANRSAYWTPAIIDITTGFPKIPKSNIIYYKHQSNYRRANPNNVVWPPENLRVIAGNPQNTAPGSPYYRWNCLSGNTVADNLTTGMASCPNGSEVLLLVFFPECWDGVNLDTSTAQAQSPPYNYPNDHQSHMAYENENTGCPASHPVMLPQVSFNIHYEVSANSRPENWRLASDVYAMSTPGGRSAHGDVVFGWSTAISDRILNKCLKPTVPVAGGDPKGHDCHVGVLGNETPSKILY